jgi:acetylornithine deacetylase/succinyl-diaminopimelate desuccinylase-like protein
MTVKPPDELRQRLLDLADDEFDNIIAFAQQVVQTPSVNPDLDPESPGEGPVAVLFKERLEQLGFLVEELYVEEGRPNLISTLAGAGDERRLLFNAHMDTVRPYENPEWLDPETGETLTEWSADPFGGDIIDGWLYGRGACDHKTEIVAMIEAVRLLQALDIELKGDLVFINDSGEETGSAKGLAHIAQNVDLNVDAVVYACTTDITELGQQYFSGMDDINVFHAVSGRQQYRLRVYGRTYHTLTPKTGWTAAENAALLLPELGDYMDRENRRLMTTLGTGKPWMRLHHITAPEYRLAEEPYVDMIVTRAVAPGEEGGEVHDRFESWVQTRTRHRDHLRLELSLEQDMEPHGAPRSHPLVQAAVNAVEAARGRQPNVAPMPTPTGIARLLNHQAYPTILFGFGSVNFHHAIDERIRVEDIVDTAKAYALIMLEFLGFVEGK